MSRAADEGISLAFVPDSKSELVWSGGSDSADGDALYRGDIASTGMRGYEHECLASALQGDLAEDTQRPAPGAALYYLVGNLVRDAPSSSLRVEGLGENTAGLARPDAKTFPCGPRVHVDPDAVAGAGSGLSWADAYTSIAAALAHDDSPERTLEVWIHGELLESEVRPTRTPFALLGGFEGSETEAYQRRPDLHETTWRGTSGLASLAPSSGSHVLVDGLTFLEGRHGIQLETAYSFDPPDMSLLVRECLFERTEDAAIVVKDGEENARTITIEVLSSTFRDGLGDAIRLSTDSAGIEGVVRASVFEQNLGAGIRSSMLTFSSAYTLMAVDVVGNRFVGGDYALVADVYNVQNAGTLSWQPSIESNLFDGQLKAAIDLRARAESALLDGERLRGADVAPKVVHNTFAETPYGLASHLVHDATYEGAYATPLVWGNVFASISEAAVAEALEPDPERTSSDATMINNLFFDTPVLLLDEGTTPLSSLAALNGLPDAEANVEGDPLFVDPAAGDYHLSAGSPCIDAGREDAPLVDSRDVDGEARITRGAPLAPKRPDLGADERRR